MSNYVQRQITAVLSQAAQTFPVLVVTGSRQVGKTTLLKHVFGKKAGFVSMDTMDIRQWAREDPRDFLRNHSAPLIIDEFQYVPEILPYIKEKIDLERIPGSYYLTGSQQLAVMKNISESLAGRVAVTELQPFTYSERKGENFETWKDWFSTVINSGRQSSLMTAAQGMMESSYPEVFTNRKIDKNLWYSSYIQTYLERDIKTYYDIGNLENFHKFMTLLAARTSSILNYNSLTSELGLSLPTVKKWFSILEASGIVFKLAPYYRNIGKRITKTPKFYFTDTALAVHLAGINSAEYLIRGNTAGQFFENMVICEFYKQKKHFNINQNLFFINHRNLWEIDLLIEENNQLQPIEVKLAATINNQHLKNFPKVEELIENITDNRYLICNSEENFKKKGINIVNWRGL